MQTPDSAKNPDSTSYRGFTHLERSLLLTLILTLILAVQGAQRLGQLNRVPGVAHSLKGGASTGVTVRGTNTTGRNSTVRVSRVVQRGDIQCVELGIIQDIRQRNLFGNRLSGRSRGSSRRLADRRTVTQSLTSHRLIRVNYRLLCGSCHRLRGYLLNGLNSLSGLRRYRLGSGCRSLLNGLNRLRLCNLRLRYPRLPRGTRRSSGGSTSGGTALLVEEHATAANRLEAARTLLATLLAVSRRRLGRTSSGRTSGCRANGTSSLRRRGRLLASSSLGCILRCLHRDVRAARACRLTVQVAGRLAGGGASGGFLFFDRVLNRRLHRLVGAIGRLFIPIRFFGFLFTGLFLRGRRKTSSTTSLDLSTCRLQQTGAAHSPRATGKNQEENSPTPRRTTKESENATQKAQTSQCNSNQQGNTARA